MGSRFSHMQQAQRAHELHSLAPLFPTDTGCSCTTQDQISQDQETQGVLGLYCLSSVQGTKHGDRRK